MIGQNAIRAAGRRRASGAGVTPVTLVGSVAKASKVLTTSTVIARPAYVTGDMFVMCFWGFGASIVNTLSGWTPIDGLSFYKVAGASEPTSYTWTHSNFKMAGVLATFRGAGGTIGQSSVGTGTTVRTILPDNSNSQVPIFSFTENTRDWSCGAITGTTLLRCETDAFSGETGGALRTVDTVTAGVSTPGGTITLQNKCFTLEILPA